MSLKKNLLSFLLLAFLMSSASAQIPVWYDYSLTYYKIPTAQDGIHRVSAATLQASGINTANTDPRMIRVFHRGKEVAIHVEGENDGKIDPQDYIDLYGIRNDAELDKMLYTKFATVPNPYYNTHSDSTAFFLTVTPGTPGKRMSQRPAPAANLPQVTSFETEQLQVFSDQYSLGVDYALGFRLSAYDQGQGWMGTQITKGAARDITFSNLGGVLNSGSATLEIGLVGRSAHPHLAVISAGPATGTQRPLTQASFSGYDYPQLSLDLQMTDFNSNGTLVVKVVPQGAQSVDNLSVAYAKITFRKPIQGGDFAGRLMNFPAGNQRAVISPAQQNYVAVDVSDLYNAQKVLVSKAGTTINFTASVPSQASKIWIQPDQSLIQVGAMQKVRFRNYLAQRANYILVGHRELEKPSSKYANPLKKYAEHRASAAGGGYDTLTLRMEELYDQFSYGERSPVALYQFLKSYYPVHKPTHILLAARSLAVYSQGRLNNQTVYYRKAPQAFSFQDLVPVGGYPFSDNVYTLNLDPAKPNNPAIAIGRIPAKTSEQLAGYLDKAIEKDQVGATEPWQKELIHLSGGVSEFELERFYAFLNGMKAVAEGPYLGGNVTTYRKRSNSVIEVIDISGDLNEGRSMLTFFGHGSPTIIDIEIGFVSDPTLGYANKGKYPIMLFNGCDYGSAFTTLYTQGEDWVITPEKGAVTVMANTSIGVDVYLKRYSDLFYKWSFADSSMIYKTIGEVKMRSEGEFVDLYGTSPLNYSHMEQMVMLGDPGVRIFPADKPDYSLKVEEASLGTFDGSPLSAISDSLKLSFVVRNLGITNPDSLDFKIDRKLPNGTIVSFDPVRIPSISKADTLVFSVPNFLVDAAGDNQFTISINTEKLVPELTFANNTITYTAFVPLSGTINLFPWNFGIVSQRDIKLITQAPGKLTESRTLIIQMDTTVNFNSAFRKETRATTAGLVEWPVSLTAGNDSTTYYWRSRYEEPKVGETDAWTNSSFSYLPNSGNGWTQRENDQLDQSGLENLELDDSRTSWQYIQQKTGFEVFTVGAGVDSLNFRNTQFYYDQIPQIIDNVNNANSRLCPNGSIGLVAIDQKTLLPYLAVPVPGFDILDSRACGRVPQMIQSIQNAWITTPGNTMLQDYVSGVKPGDYVIIFTVGSVTFDAWPDRAYQNLKEFGANEATLRALKTGDPYILYGRKGMRAGDAIEIIGNPNFEVPANQQTLSFESEVEGYFTDGVILTPKIGPASAWERFFQNVNARNWINEDDYTRFDILGVKENGEEQVVIGNVSEAEIDLSAISPASYPYLRLRYEMNDPSSTKPAQLDRWQVNFEGVPEGVLLEKNPSQPVRLQEGQSGKIDFIFKNASVYNFLDSIQVDWKMTNLTTKKVENFMIKLPAVKAGEQAEFSVEFNSIGRAGQTELEVFANPRIQREQTYQNNLIDLGVAFDVEGDNSTSLLDVNFDGVYIMDGDLVSPNVMVTALLKNDQTLLYKTDTLGMELFVKKNCEGCQFDRVNFSNPNLTWTPASENESFRVSFIPGPLEDGLYTLRITNEDSPQPYEITFEVVNESQITNFYPYPNPFSTSVRFVFTLTGAGIPDEIKIQIMTVTGKVVREILQNELGPIRIGNNITDYAWNGRDEFGDQLANGVYIYRVLVRKNGQFMEHRPTAGDKGFTKGYGKMYLLR
ncbi:C25 family cysteine peptidase [Algoriphagus terrigena]|uniref:putative type IX secretion system sortase PorU2 n=1 Tax=Algoriphagus terrigena TaxID=344884 RepID=UPI00041D8DE2|nr:C25 family cysteine peptidase [Algoriphagus terrigena]